MTPQTRIAKRILAVTPGMQYLGVAVLEGEELVWYGIKTFPGRKTMPHMRTEVQHYLTKLLQAHRPDTLAVEDAFLCAISLEQESANDDGRHQNVGPVEAPSCM